MATSTLRFLPALLLAGSLNAQNFAEITGTVLDTTGSVLAGAAVSVSNSATNQVRRAETNEAGSYRVPFLLPGVYEIRVAQPGLKTGVRSHFNLQVGDIARADFTLEVGQVSEVVEVTAASPLIDSESTAVGTVIENKRIVELPLNGRNYLQLVRLTPNVNAEMGSVSSATGRQGGERASQNLSVAGQRLQFNRFTLDGIENTDVNYNTFVIRPSIDALQEFKVQSGVYSAEYGRATSQISVTTKSGGNAFHGSVFAFHRNDNLDAREWQQVGTKNPFVRNQYGFALGGRLIRDKLFFMSNFEGLRDRRTTQGIANVATDRMRRGDFSAAGRPIFDPSTRVFSVDAQGNERAIQATPYPNNIIPASLINPISVKLLEFFPAPTVAGEQTFRNFIRQRSGPVNWDQFTQRIDWNENERSTWFGKFSWGDEFVRRNGTFQNQEGKTLTGVKQTMISNTRSFSPRLVNEFRFGYNQFRNDNLGDFAFTRNVTGDLGIVGLEDPGQEAWGTPQIRLGDGLTQFGETEETPFINRNHVFQLLNTASLVHGKHTLRFGGELRADRYNHLGNSFQRGVFTFDAKATFDPANRNTTGHSFADFLVGEARTSERALGTANALFRARSFYLFLEDSWKVTPKLTLNLGVRYENTPPWHDKYRGFLNLQFFDAGVGPDGLLTGTRVPVLTRPGEGDFHQGVLFHFHDAIPKQTGDQHLGRSMVRRDNNDFAPRIGLAYSLSSRWTVRSGFGIFFTQDMGNPKFDMARNLAGRLSFLSNEERPNSNLTDPWRNERAQAVCSNWSGACLGAVQIQSGSAERRTPYVMQWLFNVQRQLTENIALEVGYLGSGGHKLERFRLFNQAVVRTGPLDSRSVAQRRPWSAYQNIFHVDGIGNSNYNALSLKLQQRFSKGLTYLVAHTWSKSIDDASGVRQGGTDRLVPLDSYAIFNDRGLSQFHQSHRFVASALYELPFGPGKAVNPGSKLLNYAIGGWQIGSIVTFSDGSPADIGAIGDRANTGWQNQPDATGLSPVPDAQTANRFWNIAAFDSANAALSYRFGNVGRNVLIGPGLRQWDFSLIKNNRILEGHNLQFRFEAFNIPNHPTG